MKKVLVIAAVAVFGVVVAGTTFAAEGADGMMTIDKPAASFPAKKLKDGAKKKDPVTFNHKAHGEKLGCVTCHHTQPELKAGGEGKSCFECHGAEAKDKQVDSYEMIHGKTGRCIACHKAEKAKDAATKAPTGCKDCHGGDE